MTIFVSCIEELYLKICDCRCGVFAVTINHLAEKSKLYCFCGGDICSLIDSLRLWCNYVASLILEGRHTS